MEIHGRAASLDAEGRTAAATGGSTKDISMTSPSWYSVDQAAALLGVSRNTIRRMIARGELPTVRLGKRLLRIPAAALDPDVLTA